jgi:hypothetical protein
MSYQRDSRAYWKEWIAWEKGIRLLCREKKALHGQVEEREPAKASDEAALAPGESICRNSGHIEKDISVISVTILSYRALKRSAGVMGYL